MWWPKGQQVAGLGSRACSSQKGERIQVLDRRLLWLQSELVFLESGTRFSNKAVTDQELKGFSYLQSVAQTGGRL